jgi:hypothetical protein
MNPPISSLRDFLRRSPRRGAVEPDPADMGTCFGLEMTLDDPVPPAVAAQPANMSRHWWQRRPAAKPVAV